MPSLFNDPKPVAWASGGRPVPGARLYFYRAGTTTPQITYQDFARTAAHANPVLADGNGVFPPIYLDEALPDYRVLLTDSNDVPFPGYPVDPYPVETSGGGSGGTSGVPFLRLLSSDFVFRYNAQGTAEPLGQQIDFTVQTQNLGEPVIWTATGNLTGPVALTGTGGTRTLTIAAFAANSSVRVRAQSGAVFDEITAYRLTSGGIDSVVGLLTNEVHGLAADSAGTVSAPNLATAKGNFRVFSGLTDRTNDAVFSVFAQADATGTINTSANTPVAGEARGFYRLDSIAADQASLTLRAVFNGVTIDKVFTVIKARQGIQGPPGSGSSGTNGTNGQRGPGSWEANVGETGSGYNISNADVTAWDGPGAVTLALAQEAASVVLAKGAGLIQTNDRLLLADPGVRAATRVYVGTPKTAASAVVAADWSNKVVQQIDGSLIVDGTVSADKIAVTELTAITANIGTATAGTIRNASSSVVYDVTNGREIIRVGGYMTVRGAPFGSSNQFIEWSGPNLADISQCTENNGSKWFRYTDGVAYFGGGLLAGRLTASIIGVSLLQSNIADLGPFASNGGVITITGGYNFRGLTNYGPGSPGQSNPIAPSGTLVLARSVGGGAFSDVATYPVSNGSFEYNAPNFADPGDYEQRMGVGFTFVDSLATVQQRQYRLRISSWTNVNSVVVSNGLSLQSLE
jgi:hypothetical protein